MRQAGMRVLLAMLLGSALLATGAARAAETEAGSADGVLRWSEEKFVWHYSRALPPAWLEPGAGLSLFRKAAEAWANCGVRIEFAGETDLPAGRLDGANVAGWSASMRRGMRGLTLRRQAALALLEADVVINGASQELRSSPELLRKVVLHEFGHALGLVHSPDCRDVMSFGAACRHVPASALPQQPAAGDMVQCTMRYDGALAR